jgi:hypothetical protein
MVAPRSPNVCTPTRLHPCPKSGQRDKRITGETSMKRQTHDIKVPPQKLAFSTADVVILAWRLGRLADLLRENDLAPQ